ncbi:MAG: T9SS type A sorting domain-containing protein, partial [Moheibacter sp.]
EEYTFNTSGCNAIEIDMINLDEDSFIANGMSMTLEECMFPLYTDHDGKIDSFFGGGSGENFPSEDFTYEIISNSDNSKTLVVTNPDGNIAFYNNQLLSVTDILELNKNSFLIVFQNDDLIIQSSSKIVQTISIYDMNGKSVLTTNVSNNRVPTKGIERGIYIVKIIDDSGKIFTKKVRKN